MILMGSGNVMMNVDLRMLCLIIRLLRSLFDGGSVMV